LTNHGYSDGAASFYHLSNIIIILVLSTAFFESMAFFISLWVKSFDEVFDVCKSAGPQIIVGHRFNLKV